MFKPHNFKSNVKIADTNSDFAILIAPLAFEKMQHYIQQVNTEIGWLGTCYDLGGGQFYISDVFLPAQEVNITVADITKDGVAALILQLLSQENGEDIINNLRFWGHSHVNMGTTPSFQDDDQMDVFLTPRTPFYLRGIGNKHGRLEFTLFWYDINLIIEDVPWHIWLPTHDDLLDSIKTIITDNVSIKPYVPPKYNRNSHRGINVPYFEDFDELDGIPILEHDQYVGNR